MAKFSCFSMLTRRKKTKANEEPAKTLAVRLEHPMKQVEIDELKDTTFNVSIPLGLEKDSKFGVKVTAHGSPGSGTEQAEMAYEGEDEHEEVDKENCSIKRDFSDFDLQAREREAACGHDVFDTGDMSYANADFGQDAIDSMVQSGHVSDPGVRKTEFLGSPPMLKRSCSNLELGKALGRAADHLSPPLKSGSFEELRELAHTVKKYVNHGEGSPVSVNTHFSADKVMLKKHSSSQVLPSRSRRLWWKLFLWSHRNSLTKSIKPQSVPVPVPHSRFALLNQRAGGYSSDTVEPFKYNMKESPQSCAGDSPSPIMGASSGLWPQNQWVAFAGESSSFPFTRVDEWVNDLSTSIIPDDDENEIVFPPSPETARTSVQQSVLHANGLIRTLNSSSTVAHISGVGLKVMPTLSCFFGLKSVNLSGNSIVRITSGSLPKGLHVLDLSRNKISAVEGLRELTRLRSLDLSYNRIARIGHGLSGCSLIKELYLAGNKISEIEGLHRLLKLTVLDLSFNKITTTKSIGQLVPNYNSLLALNILGNPIQNNISDEQLRKAVCSLLPRLVYLNKQPLKQQIAREVVMDGLAKAAVGTGRTSARRKQSGHRGGSGKSRLSPSTSSPIVHRRVEIGSRHKKGKSRASSHTHSQHVLP
ncbi:hypothetical protein SAY87_032050 [Trapa incisa]|uniref:Leucine-rich repeat family protein n=1 Tax=Trapa incisa TaxID=236973 RepID=A0AAN7KW50_9MYRT|nr:hypothetical protein SAY87_032050 [Trapa incisa]